MRRLLLSLLSLSSIFVFGQAPAIDPPTPPVRNNVDVISIFSGAYNNITGANYNPNWQQSGFATASSTFTITNSNNTILAYPNFNYQGIEFNTVIDISAMDSLHLDIWTVGGVAPNLAVISSGQEIPHSISNVSGLWQSVNIPVNGITGNLNRTIQLKFAGGNGSSNAIYVDNIYFFKKPVAAGKDATINALEVSGTPVIGFTPNSLSYDFVLPGGSTVVPLITLATTSDTAATSIITQATNIPGTATVAVTSQDATVTKNYTVNYYIGEPHIDPPTPPSRNAVDVISIFSGAYNNISGANYNPNWQQSGYATASSTYTVPNSNNTILAYPQFNYQGIEFNSVVDISAMDSLHLDIWTVDGVMPNISVISSGIEIPHSIPNGDGTWQSINIPVTGITNTLTSAIQLKFVGGNGYSTRIYVDNIYFWKNPSAQGKNANLSALEVNGSPINGFTQNSASYNFVLPGGTTAVPQITLATPADSGATVAITQATAIPGNATVLVTSQDATVTQTYTVRYFIGAPHINAPIPPARSSNDVISIFSDSYNNITGANYNPNWQQSGFPSASASFAPVNSSNVVLAYPNFSYQGIELNSTLNITNMDFLHLDIWTVDGVVPSVSVISSGLEILHSIPNADGQWQSIDIPVPGITANLASAIQLKFIGGNGSSSRIYLDNIYFWKGQAVGIEELNKVDFMIFPNPAKDAWSLKSDQLIKLVEIIDIQGKSVFVDVVNAKSTNINAAGLENGVYFLRATSDNDITTFKLIKH